MPIRFHRPTRILIFSTASVFRRWRSRGTVVVIYSGTSVTSSSYVTSPWSHAHSLIRQTSSVLRLDRQRIPSLTLSWFRRHYRLFLVNKLVLADASYLMDDIIFDRTTSPNTSMSCCKYYSTPTRRGLLLCDWTAWLMTAFSSSCYFLFLVFGVFICQLLIQFLL